MHWADGKGVENCCNAGRSTNRTCRCTDTIFTLKMDTAENRYKSLTEHMQSNEAQGHMHLQIIFPTVTFYSKLRLCNYQLLVEPYFVEGAPDSIAAYLSLLSLDA